MLVLFKLLVLFVGFGIVAYSSKKILIDGKPEFLLFFLVAYSPIANSFLNILFQTTGSSAIVLIFRFSKDFLWLAALVTFFLHQKDPLSQQYKLSKVDTVFSLLILLSAVFTILPIGPAFFIDKAVYFKNLVVIWGVFFLGRNIRLSSGFICIIVNSIILVLISAFVLIVLEKLANTHFHSLIGYSNYELAFNDIEPTGNYGLQWTFEASGGVKRFGSFFPNPLAVAAGMLLCFSLVFYGLIQQKSKDGYLVFIGLILMVLVTLLFAYSRASIGGLALMIIFISYLLGYKRLIFAGIVVLAIAGLYVAFLAPDTIRYYVIDTLSFADSSSLGHIIEWLEGLEMISENPLGYGLATSGNVGGVIEDLQVGGENQFIIMGVQMGIQGLILYLFLVFFSIQYSARAYMVSKGKYESIIPFVAVCTKVGLLFPLFFANAENYPFTSLVSWWLVGQSILILNDNKNQTARS